MKKILNWGWTHPVARFSQTQLPRVVWLLLGLGVWVTPVTVPAVVQPSWGQTESSQSQELDQLIELAKQQQQQGQLQQAIETWQQVLVKTRELKNRRTEALALHGIGIQYYYIGNPQQALDYYNQALQIWREVGDRREEATTRQSIGKVWRNIGETKTALDFYDKALSIQQEIGDRLGEATTLNSIGAAYTDTGEYQLALEYYDKALVIRQEMGDRGGQALTLNNIGAAYNNMGQSQLALDFYELALPILQEVGERRIEAATLNNIGLFYSNSGQLQRALDYYDKALAILQKVGDRRWEAITLNNIGAVYSNNIGQSEQALNYYDKALAILRKVSDRRWEAITLNNIGAVYRNRGKSQRALDYYGKALAILQKVGDRRMEVTTLSNIGAVYRDIGKPQLAITRLEQASELILTTRKELKQEHRQAFLTDRRGTTVALVDLLIEQNQPDLAFEWVNVATTYDLADYTRLINADTQVADPHARQAIQQWNQKNQQLEYLRQQLQETFSAQLAQRVRTSEAEIYSEAETLAQTFPEVAELFETKPTDIAQLKASLPAGTVVVQPVLLTNVNALPNTIALFVLTKEKLTVLKTAIDPKEFDDLLAQYRNELQNSRALFIDNSIKLYDILIRPIEAQIQTLSPKQLSIIATGKLRYIPFETLYDSQTGQFLIQKYPINYLTRLSKIRPETSSPPPSPSLPSRVLALGNPIPREPKNLPGTEEGRC